ncbi:septin and tuftelin-interacting protein 1 homolog 1 [Brachypodium distachyon]|uniref:septin and tuftelin-interacting protein 1 homolog 1 n=1 Tax=Brachypodium distachyon TaxID=15368 RepID=UPI0001C70072|nr:septin and tuftelin-interacting protein 1 homolog 1 [Brachypodium distachyon]|eukprot:XP_003581396.3 septin and tuftelin-interacting protein 1 homolog 1 [Brachypodium distachyon]
MAAPMPGRLAFTSPAVAKMMRLWNYEEGSGLGVHGQGIIAPIQPTAWPQKAGLGHRDKPYDNGLDAPPTAAPANDEWLHQWEVLSRAQRLETECFEKTLALLQELKLQGDDSPETADALAAVIKSREVFQLENHTPGMWKAALPSSTTRYIIEQIVTPKIAMGAQEWQPAWDPDCHDWLRPWIPLISHLPRSLYDAVEGKITSRIDDYDVVSPWKDYLDPACWDAFAARHVLPKIARLVRELRITPPKQADRSFRWAMLWAPLVRVQHVVSILEDAEFWDRWEGALRHWLRSSKPSFGEADAWCAGWKNLFTPELLADERVRAHLHEGAGMVDRARQDLDTLVFSW